MRLTIYETGENTTFQFFETCMFMHGTYMYMSIMIKLLIICVHEFWGITFTQRDDFVHMLIRRTNKRKALLAVRWNMTENVSSCKRNISKPFELTRIFYSLSEFKKNDIVDKVNLFTKYIIQSKLWSIERFASCFISLNG